VGWVGWVVGGGGGGVLGGGGGGVVVCVLCSTCGASFCAMTSNLGVCSASVWSSMHGESVWYVWWECVVMG